MAKNISFEKLFIFEMANNHMGDVEHGLRIIRELDKVRQDFAFTCAIKLQYRDIDTFIHPDYKNNYEFKYIKRFSETRLSDKEFLRLKEEAEKLGFLLICTPFDENSVDKIVNHKFDIIKIASCSFTDWPLLEKIAETDLPIIASTAGVSLDEIDRVVVFFEHRRKKMVLMHCVGEYPTREEHLNLNQIELFRQRYPNITIGYSAHESPDNFAAIKIAIGKGAEVFERHVGIPTDKYALNGYSSTPEQIRKWLTAAKEAIDMCGKVNSRREIYEKEESDLRGLMRGVFAKQKITKGERITTANTFFAIPNFNGQIVANNMSKYQEYIARKNINVKEPIYQKDVTSKNLREKVLNIIGKIRNMLIESKVHLPHMLQFELSHHYGLDRFNEWGATIINCVNREYCKKLVIMLPNQRHPMHFHKKKEETFQIIFGELILDLGKGEKKYNPGDIVVIERNVKHGFSSEKGVIFEEVSTKHHVDDSFYNDEEITANKNRKTEMTFWTDWLHKPLK
jgi:sialic acid synthase SpsE/quercetin dioxygenase-like cupin family protein